jgi:hypothetical protein
MPEGAEGGLMNDSDDKFVIDRWALTPEKLATINHAAAAKAEHPQQKQHPSKEFTILPDSWEIKLRGCRHKATYPVAVFLLRQHWKTKGRPFKVPNLALAERSVDRYAKWRALEELEELGLIQVERRSNRSPIVTILIK